MIAIPNMDKPKECKDCQWHLDFYIEDKQVGGLCTITEKDDKENTCPLIDIITCGECKHWYNDADCGMACEFTNMRQPSDGFCNWGERATDE